MAYKKYGLMKIAYEDGKYKYAIVKDSDGKETKLLGSDIDFAIYEFAEQEKINPIDLLNDTVKIQRIEEKSDEKKPEKSIVEKTEKKEKKEDSIKKETKVVVEEKKEEKIDKKTPKSKRIKALLLAIGFMASGFGIGYVIDRLRSRENAGKESEMVNDNYTDTKLDETPYVYEDDNSFQYTQNDGSVVNVTEYPAGDDYNYAFASNLSNDSRHERLYDIVRRFNLGEMLTDEDCEYLFDSVTILNQANIAEVEKLVNGGRMSGDEYNLSYQDMFPVGSYDYEVVKYFLDMRNNFVHGAYRQNRGKTLNAVNDFLNIYVDFVFNDGKVNYQGNELNFYALSPMARFVITDLGSKVLETNHNYSANINGYEYSYNDLLYEFNNVHIVTVNDVANGNKIR